MNAADLTTVTVRRDEAERLASGRCTCGHLVALHSTDDLGQFCTLDECECAK